MKYKWATQIMTRQSGLMTIFCNSREQASGNVSAYTNARIKDSGVINFDNISKSPNIFVMDEIVAVSVADMELLFDVHMQEIIDHKRMEKEIEFSLNNDGD